MSIRREIEVKRKGLPRPIDVTYGTNMLPIEFIITDFELPEGATVEVYAMGRSNKLVKQSCVISKNIISFIPEIGLFEEGKNVLQLAATYVGKDLFSFYIPVNCQKTMVYEGAQDLENDPTFVAIVMQMKEDIANKITTPEAAEVGQILEVEEVDENGKPTKFIAVDKPTGSGEGGGLNPNLLINGDFQVNQRGQTSYSGNLLYTVDRWRMNGNGTVTLQEDGGLALTASGAWRGVHQYIENPSFLSGKTITISAKCYSTDGDVCLSIRRIKNSSSESLGSIRRTDVVNASIISTSITLPEISDEDKIVVALWTSSANATSVWYWVKLELGSVATPFVPRHYAEELDLCQRYHDDYDIIEGYILFRVGEKSAYFSISLPCALRTTPTLTLKNNQVRWESSIVKTSSVTNIEVKSMINNHIVVKLEGNFGLTSWQNCLLYDIGFVLDSEIY